MNIMPLKEVIVYVALAALATGACQTARKTPSAQSADSADNSQNALDWAGIYQGTLPCADCPGIRYTLTLKENNKYLLKSIYLEKGDSVFTDAGIFTWNDSGSRITLSDRGEQFQVGENKLFHLDMEGNRITGNLADHYVLAKLDDAILDKRWKLFEVNGKSVASGTTQNEPFIRLTSENNRVEANGGCNSMGGSFELANPNRIKFSQLFGTLMACENMEVENALGNALKTADSYIVLGDTLQLFRARMAPLAKFTAQPE